jgi:spore coat protein A, manganese oxidase
LSSLLPSTLNPTLARSFPNLPTSVRQRTPILIDQGAPNTVAMMLDGQPWDAPASEKPQVGTTEGWTIINPTMNSHPIHLHLVQFQLVERQIIASAQYQYEWDTLNGNLPLKNSIVNVVSLSRYLEGQPVKPALNEQCWKDTIQADAGSITVIRIRFAPQDGSNYQLDAAVGSGYVWHCHILDHEDNEMMRPGLSLYGCKVVISLIF